jgi:hypothetical protein
VALEELVGTERWEAHWQHLWVIEDATAAAPGDGCAVQAIRQTLAQRRRGLD